MKILVAGTPAVAIPTLRTLVDDPRHEVRGVLTREDAPQGRKRVLTPSPLAQAAEEIGLPIIKANRVTADVIAEIAALDADIGVVVAYGALLSQAALDAMPHGWINLHFSALPKWRGAAPVQRAILAADTPAVSVFQLVKALDAGPIWQQTVFSNLNNLTAGQLLNELASKGTTTVLHALTSIARGEQPTAQPEDSPTPYAAKLTSKDGDIDWTQSAVQVWRQFAAATPEPGAFSWVARQRCKIIDMAAPDDPQDAERSVSDTLSSDIQPATTEPTGTMSLTHKRAIVQVGNGRLEILTVQPFGKRPMPAADWLRGHGGRLTFTRSHEIDGAAS